MTLTLVDQIELFLHSGLLDALQLIEILPTAQQLESDVGAVDTERILQQFGHRQTDSRSDTWSFDETAEQWYDEAAELQEAEYARPFDPSSARRFKNETSTPSETLKNQLLKLANRIKPLLESSLFARKSVFLCRHVILTPSYVKLSKDLEAPSRLITFARLQSFHSRRSIF